MKWFKHDSNARHDPRISKLIMRFGIEGYGLYFACVEMIAEKLSAENISFELQHDAELISHEFKIDPERVEQIMKYCISLNLFQFSQKNNKIFCQALCRRVDNTLAQVPQFKALLEVITTKRIEDNLSNLKLIQETCSIGEESRVEKRRGPPPPPLKQVVAKKEYAESVLLSEQEWEKLVARFGEPVARRLVDTLSIAKLAKGYIYKSDYAAILKWVVKECGAVPLEKIPQRGWKCPHCGHRNVQTGSVCYRCHKDRDDEPEADPF